jgi:hypothetical protein
LWRLAKNESFYRKNGDMTLTTVAAASLFTRNLVTIQLLDIKTIPLEISN